MRRPTSSLARPLALAAKVALLAALPGCQACKNDHPFVPYRIEGGTPAPSSSVAAVDAAPPAPPPDASAAVHEPALLAPPHATAWTVGKLALTAPPGGMFRQGLAWDLDGDGRDDALALVEIAGPVLHDELYFYRGGADGPSAPTVVPLGEAVPVGWSNVACARVERLARVGKRSVAVEVGETCPAGMAGRGPDRVVALVAWADGMKTRLALPVVDPPGAQTLALEVDGADVDGDGLDDATLRVSLEGGEPPFEPGPPVHAVFRWFDRPAGMSREPGEPERSLHAIAANAAQRASRTKEAAAALGMALAGRQLFQAVCAESSARRVAPPPAPSPLACEAGHALEELGLATTRAHVTEGDVLRAIAALDGAGLPPASRTPARIAEATGWVTTLAPVAQATLVRAVSAVPRPKKEAASWGPLRFGPAGELLVQTMAGVVRVDPVHGDEADAPGDLAWASTVLAPRGERKLVGAFATCGRVALEATLAVTEGAHVDGGDATTVALPVATPIGGRCTPGERDPVPVIPLAWGAGGLELLVAGEPVLVAPDGVKASPLFQLLGQPVTPGAPRSPDGVTLVVPTSQGLFVRGAKGRLFRARELEHGYGEVRDCAVSNDGLRVACVRGGVAFVGIWPAP